MSVAPILIDMSSQVDLMEPNIHTTMFWNRLMDPKLVQYSISKVPLYNMETYEWHSTMPHIMSIKIIIW